MKSRFNKLSARAAGHLALTVAATATFALPVAAMEFRSVASPAILFDAPSAGARPLFILSPGTPVEVVVESGDWVRVRDMSGTMNWLERVALSNQRTVLVTAERAVVRSAPDQGAAISFEVRRDVVLDLLAPPQAGWAQVRHRDGHTGYIRITEVWGR